MANFEMLRSAKRTKNSSAKASPNIISPAKVVFNQNKKPK